MVMWQALCTAQNLQRQGIDMYMGTGGAPEGVLAAAALKCMGGQIYGRLLFRNDDEKSRAHKAGITELDRIYTRDEMVTQDVIFAATGVTGGSLLPGIKRDIASSQLKHC
jgi:fructose-1,6-bisphosphatase II / sedoheptulose-1,7-bisphosphatase